MAAASDHRPSLSTVPEPRLVRFGAGHPLVVVDRLCDDIPAIRSLAAALAPFPPATQYYPGVRRLIEQHDTAAWSYVRQTAQSIAPYVAGAFDCEGFELVEASFSIVTTAPGELSPPQRAPHFDSIDPDLIAVLHYLGDVPGSGTAFFRHRATGIEQITDANVAAFVTAARRETGAGYVQGTNDHYDELHRVDAKADRLLVYQGSLLHSGIIPPEMPLDPDPMKGRLTANFFLKLNR